MPTILTFMSRVNLCSVELSMKKLYNLRPRYVMATQCFVLVMEYIGGGIAHITVFCVGDMPISGHEMHMYIYIYHV